MTRYFENVKTLDELKKACKTSGVHSPGAFSFSSASMTIC